ncbi:polymer-forming cytoskeletal protein [Lysobacter sp. A03]|uniref:bactofilin family protein n=1 Tax=Lysobacter sp. A03 TaxID=1199154 RepID=UPI0005B72475|nr:Integral membrane protein CcmA involved in cell shape determination [Lysobacter sp. A03]
MLKKKASVPASQIDTLIGAQVVIRGDFHFSGGLYVEGRVIGKLIADDGEKAVLTLADNGIVEGEVRAPVMVINGTVNGNVYATERIELGSKARVDGNVHYKVVQMAAGSVLTGRLLHVDSEQAYVGEDHMAEAEGMPRLATVNG